MSRTKKTAAGKKGDAFAINTVDQLKAIADPLRQQLLEQFAKGPATTKQVAQILGRSVTPLYHHVARLEKAGLIELVETKPSRGATEKYFSAIAPQFYIDRRAFSGSSATLVKQVTSMSLDVLGSLFARVRQEVADFLDQASNEDESAEALELAEQEVFFAQYDVQASDEAMTTFRAKLESLITELEDAGTDETGSGRRHRLLIGIFPRSRRPTDETGNL